MRDQTAAAPQLMVHQYEHEIFHEYGNCVLKRACDSFRDLVKIAGTGSGICIPSKFPDYVDAVGSKLHISQVSLEK